MILDSEYVISPGNPMVIAHSYVSFTVMRDFDRMVCCVEQKFCDLLDSDAV